MTTEHRDMMDQAIQEVVVPVLREAGFRGSLPHFRRKRGASLDLLSFQHFSAGGSFVVEIAQSPADGIVTSWGKRVPANKMTVIWIGKRLRLGSRPSEGVSDHWYEFGPRSYDREEPVKQYEHYLKIAEQVVRDIRTQAEEYWRAG